MIKLIIYGSILLIGLTYYIYTIRSSKQIGDGDYRKKTAQDFTNVLDINQNFLYTKDKKIFSYIKINPISIDLMSTTEIENFTKNLTAELSGIEREFKMLALSRTVDITPLTNTYKELMRTSKNSKQKELLREEIETLNYYALSSKVTERQFYIVIYEKYVEGIERDFSRVANDIVTRFRSASVVCEVINDTEIKKLVNTINNPAYIGIEESV